MEDQVKVEWIDVPAAVDLGLPRSTLYRLVGASRIEKRTLYCDGGRQRLQVRRDQVTALVGDRRAGGPPAVRGTGTGGLAKIRPEDLAALRDAIRAASRPAFGVVGWAVVAVLAVSVAVMASALSRQSVAFERGQVQLRRSSEELVTIRADVSALREELAAMKHERRSRFLGIF